MRKKKKKGCVRMILVFDTAAKTYVGHSTALSMKRQLSEKSNE